MRFLLVLLALAGACAQDGATHADWPHYGGTQFSWRYSALDQVNTGNVKDLVPVWMFQTGDYAENLQATPDRGGWRDVPDHAAHPGVRAGCGHRPRAVAVQISDAEAGQAGRHDVRAKSRRRGERRQVFFGTTDNFLVALDQKTGGEQWKVSVDDPRQCGCDITAAPLVVKDKVIVGGNGGDAAHRGYLTAFYAKTGRFAWRWYVIPGPGEKGHETWKGDSWKLAAALRG
jgi:alcohol dehydrogenase (cytochrome c)